MRRCHDERNWEYSGVHKTLEKVKQRKEKTTDADTVLKKIFDKEYEVLHPIMLKYDYSNAVLQLTTCYYKGYDHNNTPYLSEIRQD